MVISPSPDTESPPLVGALFSRWRVGLADEIYQGSVDGFVFHFDDCMCIFEETVAPTQEYKSILDSRASALQQLGTATVCCSSLSGLKYQPLIADQKRIVAIDGNSPVFTFPEGKSYFAAFKLPSNSGDLKITIAGLIDKTLFNPTVLLLDSQFKSTRTISSDIITYKPARMLDGDRVEGVFTIDRSYVGNPNNETYMVVYTTQAALSQTTQAMSPSKMMAKSPECAGLWCQGSVNTSLQHGACSRLK